MIEGNHFRALRVRPVLHDRMQAEDVDVHRRTGGERASAVPDLLHHDRGFGDAHAGAAKFHRHRDAKPTAVGHRIGKLVGKLVQSDLSRTNSRRRICHIALVSRFGFRCRSGVFASASNDLIPTLPTLADRRIFE